MPVCVIRMTILSAGERRGCSVYGKVGCGSGSGTCHVSPDAPAAAAAGPPAASIPTATAAATSRGPVVVLVRNMDMGRVAELVWGAAGGGD